VILFWHNLFLLCQRQY